MESNAPSSSPNAPASRREAGNGAPAAGSDAAPNPRAGAARRRFRPRAWHAAGLLLLLAVAGLLLYGFWPALTGAAQEDAAGRGAAEDPGESVTRVGVVATESAPFLLRAEATGHLAPWRRALVSAEAGGLVTRRLAEEGDYVREGALLLQLDDQDEQIELEDAEAQLLQARATYAVNTRGIEDISTARDTAGLAAARAQARRAEAAFEKGLITEEDLEEVRRRLDARELLDGSQRDKLYAINAGVMEARQRVERARLALSRTQVRAPFAGRVADLGAEEGQRVAAGETLCALLDTAPMKVEVDVLEEDLVRIEEGGAARVRVPSLGAGEEEESVFEGAVHSVNPSVDPAAGTGRVTVAIPNAEGRLLAGLFAEVAIEIGRLDEQIALPAEAVLERQGRELVFVVQGSRAQWTYVTTGARSGGRVVITEGLGPGDTVATSGHFALAHDAPVTVRQADSTAAP